MSGTLNEYGDPVLNEYGDPLINEYGDPVIPDTERGALEEYGVAFARGTGHLGSSAAGMQKLGLKLSPTNWLEKGIRGLIGADTTTFREQAAQGLGESAQQTLAEPGMQRSEWSQQGAARYGYGTVEQVPMMAAQAVAALFSGGGTLPATITMAGTGGMMEAGSTYEAAKQRGVDEGTAVAESLLYGTVAAALETIPSYLYVKATAVKNPVVREAVDEAIKSTVRQRIGTFLRSGKDVSLAMVAEAATEMAQTDAEAAITALAEQNPELWKEAMTLQAHADVGITSALLGGGMQVAGQAVGAARQGAANTREANFIAQQNRRAQEFAERERVASMPMEDPEFARNLVDKAPDVAQQIADLGLEDQPDGTKSLSRTKVHRLLSKVVPEIAERTSSIGQRQTLWQNITDELAAKPYREQQQVDVAIEEQVVQPAERLGKSVAEAIDPEVLDTAVEQRLKEQYGRRYMPRSEKQRIRKELRQQIINEWTTQAETTFLEGEVRTQQQQQDIADRERRAAADAGPLLQGTEPGPGVLPREPVLMEPQLEKRTPAKKEAAELKVTGKPLHELVEHPLLQEDVQYAGEEGPGFIMYPEGQRKYTKQAIRDQYENWDRARQRVIETAEGQLSAEEVEQIASRLVNMDPDTLRLARGMGLHKQVAEMPRRTNATVRIQEGLPGPQQAAGRIEGPAEPFGRLRPQTLTPNEQAQRLAKYERSFEKNAGLPPQARHIMSLVEANLREADFQAARQAVGKETTKTPGPARPVEAPPQRETPVTPKDRKARKRELTAVEQDAEALMRQQMLREDQILKQNPDANVDADPEIQRIEAKLKELYERGEALAPVVEPPKPKQAPKPKPKETPAPQPKQPPSKKPAPTRRSAPREADAGVIAQVLPILNTTFGEQFTHTPLQEVIKSRVISDALSFAESLAQANGVEVSYVAVRGQSNSATGGAMVALPSGQRVVVINVNQADNTDAMWTYISDEMWHATGLDMTAFPVASLRHAVEVYADSLLESQRFERLHSLLAGAGLTPPPVADLRKMTPAKRKAAIRKMLRARGDAWWSEFRDTESPLRREAGARVASLLFQDPSFRQQVLGAAPTWWSSFRSWIAGALRNWAPLTPKMRAAKTRWLAATDVQRSVQEALGTTPQEPAPTPTPTPAAVPTVETQIESAMFQESAVDIAALEAQQQSLREKQRQGPLSPNEEEELYNLGVSINIQKKLQGKEKPGTRSPSSLGITPGLTLISVDPKQFNRFMDTTLKAVQREISGFAKKFPALREGMERSSQWFAGQVLAIKQGQNDLAFAAADYFGVKHPRKLNDAQREQIRQWLQGEVTVPPQVAGEVRVARNLVDSWGQMVKHIFGEDSPLGITIEKKRGHYLTTTYQIFDEDNPLDNVDIAAKNRFKDLLLQEHRNDPDFTPEVAEAMINYLLVNKGAIDLSSKPAGNASMAVALSRFKALKDLPQEYKDLLKENRDPFVMLMKTAQHLLPVLKQRMFLEIFTQLGSQPGPNQILYPKRNGMGNAPAEFSYDVVKAPGPLGKALEPLANFTTSKEVAEEINRMVRGVNHDALTNLWMHAVRAVRMSKTAFSLPYSLIRDTATNIYFLTSNGHLGSAFRYGILGAKLTWRDVMRGMDVGIRGDVDLDALSKEMYDEGVQGENVGARMLQDSLNDAWDLANIDDLATNRSVPGRVKKSASKIYESSDIFFKSIAYLGEKRNQQKMHPDWSEAQVRKAAAEWVKETFPNYARASTAAKRLRDFPLAGTFVMFPSETLRIIKNQFTMPLKEIAEGKRTGNQRMVAIGMTRLASLGLVAFGPEVVAYMLKKAVGITDEEEDDDRRFGAPWERNSLKFYYAKTKDGVRKKIDMGAVSPYEIIRRPLVALLKGDDNHERHIIAAMSEPMKTFMDMDIFTKAVSEAYHNQTTMTKSKVYNEEADPTEQTLAIAKHIGKAFLPTSFTALRDMIAAAQGDTSRGTVKDQLIRTFGPRPSITDTREQYPKFKVKNLGRRFADSTYLLTQYSGSSRKYDTDFIARRAETMYSAKNRIVQQAHGDFWAAVRGGMTFNEAFRDLRDVVGQENAVQIAQGVFRPRPPSLDALQRAYRYGGFERRDAMLRAYRNAVRKYHPDIEQGMRKYNDLRARYSRRAP